MNSLVELNARAVRDLRTAVPLTHRNGISRELGMEKVGTKFRTARVGDKRIIVIGDGENSSAGNRSFQGIISLVCPMGCTGILFVDWIVKFSVSIISGVHLRYDRAENVNSWIVDFHKYPVGHSGTI